MENAQAANSQQDIKSKLKDYNPGDLVPVQLDIPKIKKLLKTNHEFFIQFALGDKLTFPVPKFHLKTFKKMVSLEEDLFSCVIPRGHSKTTLAKLACVYLYLFTDVRFIVYVSNTVGVAIPSTNDIMAILRSPNFVAVFGEPEELITREGHGAYKFKIDGKICLMRAFGLGQQIRGLIIDHQRPEVAVLDDVDRASADVTPKSFEDIKKWFYGPFYKAFESPGQTPKMIQLGNLTSNESLIAEHVKDPDWYSIVYGCLQANGQPLWPDFWNVKALRKDYLKYQRRNMLDTWFAEMMNIITAGSNSIIRGEDIQYKPRLLPEDYKYKCITIDLAISDKEWAHKTVVVAHGFNQFLTPDGAWQSLEHLEFVGIDPVLLFWQVYKLALKWKISVIGIEEVAYQSSVKYVFAHECRRNNIPFNEDNLPGKQGLAFVKLTPGDKTQRIVSWAGLLKSGAYFLTEGDFTCTYQLLSYDVLKKENDDDVIDAHAYINQMQALYLDLITTQVNPHVNKSIRALNTLELETL